MDKLSLGAAKGLQGVEGEKDDENESAGEIKVDAIESAGDMILDAMLIDEFGGMLNECNRGPALLLSESGCSPNWNMYISEG